MAWNLGERSEDRKVQLVLNQIMNSVLERAGLKLLLIVDHHHAVLAVVVRLEAWHATLLVDLTPDYQIRGFSTASTIKLTGVQKRSFWTSSGGSERKLSALLYAFYFFY